MKAITEEQKELRRKKKRVKGMKERPCAPLVDQSDVPSVDAVISRSAQNRESHANRGYNDSPQT